jgi:hypothetical protein
MKDSISLERSKYLLSISEDLLKSHIIRNPEDWNGENHFSNIDIYASKLKRWLKESVKQIETKGNIEVEYKHSNQLQNCGRKYVEGFGTQKLTRELRGFLCSENSYDIDIVNCAPSILLSIMKKHYPKKSELYEYLGAYVYNREIFLKQSNLTKIDVIKAMNSAGKIKSSNQGAVKLDKEFKSIQKLFLKDYEKEFNLPDTAKAKIQGEKTNPGGKLLNLILTLKESEILESVSNRLGDKVNSLVFDGFHLDKSADLDETLIELNKMSKENGIAWIHKPFDDSIKMDESISITYEDTPTYEECKIIFEKNHFMILSPLMFASVQTVEGEELFDFQPKDKFRDLVKPYKYYDALKGKDLEFFPTWLEDKKRRSYKKMGFIPKLNNNNEVYNSFKGLQFKKTESEIESEVIEIYMNHLKLLTGYEKGASEYFHKYICHLIQKPEVNPEVGVLLKSSYGFGKDSIINLIQKLIGLQYVFRTAEIKDIFGDYNVGIREKLLLVMNETEGKDGFSNKEKIKNLITEEYTTIREKYVSQYSQKNYMRLFVLSNNPNPIEVPAADRRFAVFKAHHQKPNQQYFNKFYNLINDNSKLQMLFNHLSTEDISDFKIKDIPDTKARVSMKKTNENPLYKFLSENFTLGGDYESNFKYVKKHKKSGLLYVKSNEIIKFYREYLKNNNLDYVDINFKLMKTLLNEINIEKKSVKISGTASDYYIIDSVKLEETLNSLGIQKEEVLEFDDDEFESEDEGKEDDDDDDDDN